MKMRKIIAVMAAALMLLSILPMAVFAADAETIKYTISNYPAGTQYKAETRKLDDYLTVITNTRCHFTSELRIYAPSGSVNGEVILASTRELTTVVLNAGNKASTLTVSTSPDNSTWTQHSTLSVASSYKDLSISNLPAGTKYIKLVNGSGQVRIKYITVSYAADAAGDCEHVNAEYEYDCQPGYCSDCESDLPAKADHTYEEEITIEPDCTTAGEKTLTCECGDVKTEAVKALGHTYVDGACEVCGAEEPNEVVFELGADGTAVHSDGNTTAITAYTETSGSYTLTFSNLSNVYRDARDAAGNGCIKLGGSSKAAELTFTVPDDVISVIIKAAKYKANTSKLSVNGNTTTLTKNSNDGEYDEIIVDTTSNKTISLETVSGGYRVMLNSITFVLPSDSGESDCAHEYAESARVDATCGADGSVTYTCGLCGDTYDETLPATGEHTGEDYVCSVCGAIMFPAADEVVSIADAITIGSMMAHDTATTDKYYITGVIKSVANTQYGNLYIQDENGNELYVWGTYSYNGSVRYDALEYKPVVGDEVTLYTVIGNYNGPQLKNVWLDEVVAHEHDYDNNFDVDCNKCGAIREVSLYLTEAGTSASTDVRGVAALFNIDVDGLAIKEGTATEADYTNATVNGYKLISMGAFASNGVSEKDIPVVYMYELNEETISYAIRVKNIPEGKEDVEITFTPYFVVEIDGVETTFYGEAQTASYAEKVG